MRSVESLLQELNPPQADAVRTIKGPLLVLAGAGTGKTKVITTRIAYMLANNIRPENIVAVSFTNKAAREMRERLASFVGSELASQTELSTFHSFALKILRHYAKDFGLPRRFGIADENQAKNILREALRELKLQDLIPLNIAASRISFFKDQLLKPEDFAKAPGLVNATVMRDMFELYNTRLRLYSLVDFDDIVYLAAMGLKENPSVLQNMRAKYPYLMVDEYQDTNNAQFEFIRLMADVSRNICVVGDDDQSIYSWRGAKGDVLQIFLNCFPEAKRVSLEQNYRCSPRILDAANAVIAENTKRLPKKLWSDQANKYPIRLHAAENERDEALFVADMIPDLIEQHKIPYHQIAALVRASEQTIALEQVFAERHIPYHVHGGTRFLDRVEVRILFSYLRLAANSDDLSAFFTCVNIPPRGVGTAALEKIRDSYAAQKKEGDLAQVVSQFGATHKGVQDFCDKWSQAAPAIVASQNLAELADALKIAYENVGLAAEIKLHCKDMKELLAKRDLIDRVLDVVKNLQLKEFSLQAVMDALHLDDTAPREKAKDPTDKVQIMTIHAAKGLEFFGVFLVGIEDGILPHERSMAEGSVDEERRLFYVAITRAKQRLFMSHCGFRSKGRSASRERERIPSRFLKAIPPELLQQSETEESSEEARAMSARKRLFELFR